MPSADFFKPNTIAPDPYRVLQIARTASDGEIKRAYFTLVRQFPPEREPVKFQAIRAAYDQLRTPESRARIDLFLLQPPPPLPNRRRPSYDLALHNEDLCLFAVELVATAPAKDFQP